MSLEVTDEDTFNILVATDNHLGFAEKDPIRGNDSFDTFEEILRLAAENDVDMLLLGGDLFHEANPSSYSISKCLQLLKKYCVGGKEVAIQFLSDPKINFSHLENPIVNYEDPNLNISIPVFSIHGNHDDPTGHKQVSALDILSKTGFINYFGRQDSLTDIKIHPLLLSKGETHLAIYGLSHLRDERLGRLYHDKKVLNQKPDGDMWFHMMILHQNRVDRGRKRFVPTTFLPNYLRLVIWGHEHDCYIDPVDDEGICIVQPGSSVATSLSEGESRPKHVGLLKINKHKFKMCPIKLETVRPFVHKEIDLGVPDSSKYGLENPSQQAMKMVTKVMREILDDLKKENAGTPRANMLPLIRIVAFYNDERQGFNTIKFCQEFIDEIANPSEAVVLKHYRTESTKRKTNKHIFDDDIEINQDTQIETYLLGELEKNPLEILSGKLLTDALQRYATMGDDQALTNCINKQIHGIVEKLVEADPTEDDIPRVIEQIKEIDFPQLPRAQNSVNNITNQDCVMISDDEYDEAANASTAANKRGRGRGRGRGRAASKDTTKALKAGRGNAGTSRARGRTSSDLSTFFTK